MAGKHLVINHESKNAMIFDMCMKVEVQDYMFQQDLEALLPKQVEYKKYIPDAMPLFEMKRRELVEKGYKIEHW